MKQSKAFSWNYADTITWVRSAVIFLTPTLLVLIPSLIGLIPADYKYAALVIYVLNRIVKFLELYVSGKK